jgi:uncharacterized membrane protein
MFRGYDGPLLATIGNERAFLLRGAFGIVNRARTSRRKTMSRRTAQNTAQACASQFDEHGRGVNVGDAERALSILLGGGLVLGGVRRIPSLSGALLALAGGGLIYRGLAGHCQLYQALGMSTSRGVRTGVPARHGTRVEKSILIDAPPEAIYRFWRDFENLPRFVNHIQSVRPLLGTRSHWVAAGPLGIRVEWDAEIVNDIPNRLIAWRSLEGSQVDTAGTVRFAPGPAGRGTEVRVELKYDPPGGKAGVALARLFGHAPDEQLAADLLRLQRVIEAGEFPTTAGQAAVGVQSTLGPTVNRAAATDRYDLVEETSAESFPASDAPGWANGAASRRVRKE